jgi:hypothetical protein
MSRAEHKSSGSLIAGKFSTRQSRGAASPHSEMENCGALIFAMTERKNKTLRAQPEGMSGNYRYMRGGHEVKVWEAVLDRGPTTWRESSQRSSQDNGDGQVVVRNQNNTSLRLMI